jgi:DNA-3-methyladenine glycosylase II
VTAVATTELALTEMTLLEGVRELASRDRDLAEIAARYGPPPLWARPPGFPTLVRIMLEQQVSLASARAAFERLSAEVRPLTPAGFLELDDGALLTIGFSHQKARYVRGLARAIEAGAFDLDRVSELDDAEANRELVGLTGVGPWTAAIYLLMALRRPDVWPAADMALVAAVAEVKGLGRRPGPEEMESISLEWRPWRSVAARLLWHEYLHRRGRGGSAERQQPAGPAAASSSRPAPALGR